MRAHPITNPQEGTPTIKDAWTVLPPLARLTVTLALLLAIIVLSRPVSADATSYATAQRQLRVGILLLDSTAVDDPARGPENPDPFVFYVADAYTELKPQNWEFINPLAPGAVTTSIRARWLSRDSRNPYRIGQKVTKNMAAYWEVPLKTTDITDLLQYDLLLIHTHRTVAFSPIEREKLRKVVDAGGIVWMEDCGRMKVAVGAPFFLEEVQFQGGSPGRPRPIVNVADHPILNAPFRLTFDEISTLGDKTYGDYSIGTLDPTDQNKVIQSPPNPETLVNIIGNGNRNGLPYVAAGHYGGGTIIITSGDSCCDINDYAGGTNAGAGGNSGAYSGTNIKTAHTEDLKFLYNIASWGSSNNAFRRNNRRLATSFDGVGAPLITAFNIRNPYSEAKQTSLQSLVDARSAPLIVKNVMYVAGLIQGTKQVTIRAYDVNPYSDLDGDGNPDDGRPDLSLGLPYDEIWRWDGPTVGNNQYPSAPILGSVLLNAATDIHEDRIFVTLPDGSIVTFQATPRMNGGLLAGSQVGGFPLVVNGVGGAYDAMPQGVAPAPSFFENRIYAVEPSGLVLCVNALDSSELWRTFKGNAPSSLGKPCGTPTLGFSRQDSNTPFARESIGATNDLMFYVPSIIADDGSGNKNVGNLVSYWLGTRNEVLSFRDNRDPAANTQGILNTRVAGGPGGPQANQYFLAMGTPFRKPNARVFSGNGTLTALQQYAAGNVSTEFFVAKDGITEDGKVQFQDPKPTAGSDVIVSIDYDVVYIAGDKVPSEYASNPTLVGARNNEAMKIQNIDLGSNGNVGSNYGFNTPTFSPDDSLLFGVNQQFQGNSPGDTPGSLVASVYSINEQEGLETTRVRWRFSQFNESGGLTVTRQVDETTVEDRVPLVNYLIFDANWPASTGATTQPSADDPKQLTVEPLTNVRIVGSPVTSNAGLTYVLAEGTSPVLNGGKTMTVLLALKTAQSVVLNLPEPFETTRGVTISQANMVSSPSNPDVVTVRSGSPQLTLDGDRGRITLNNFRAANNAVFSASQSFVVRYTPKGASTEKRAVINPVPRSGTYTYTDGTDESGAQVNVTPTTAAYTPLQWYYVLPGEPLSSPTLVGDFIYYTMRLNGSCYVVGLEKNPASNDPKVRTGYGEPIYNVATHVRMVQQIDTSSGPLGAALAVAPPVAGQGVLALNSSLGTYTLTDSVTAVADNRRLMEVAADGSVRWQLDATVQTTVSGGRLPVYGPDGQPIVEPGDAQPNGRIVKTRLPLSRPTAIQKINSDYMIADSGNNRVVRVDRAGEITWEMQSFVDAYGILNAGEPQTLNNPTDIQLYIAPSFDNSNNVNGYEVHYLIADSGNFRIIEVADYYDANGNAKAPTGANIGDHVLVWTSRTTSSQGRKLRFVSIQRFLTQAPGLPNVTGYPYISAVVSNSSLGGTTNTTVDTAGGSIVTLQYAPYNTYVPLRDTGSQAVTVQRLWVAGATEPTGNGTVLNTASEIYIIKGGEGTAKKIAAPTYFRQINMPSGRTLFLICDANAAYVVTPTVTKVDGVQKQVNGVIWMFDQSDYNAMNATRIYNPNNAGKLPVFRPSAIQLLANGNYLVTNSATERNTLFASGQFVGEAFEVQPLGQPVLTVDLNPGWGLDGSWITPHGGTFPVRGFSVPNLVTGNGTTRNEQRMGQSSSNTGLLEQPKIAIRP